MMFGDFWRGGPRPFFAQAGDWGPGGYEGWQPWARPDDEWEARGGRGRGPWGRREHEHGHEHGHGHERGHRHGHDRGPGGWGGPGGPWGGPRRDPWGDWGGGPWGGPGGPFGPGSRFDVPYGGPWGGPGNWLWRFSRRFPFGPGGPFGPEGPGMGPGMGPRMFGRGDLKYALLDLLRERPKHGYEMIKDLEERSGGFYTPSAGAIYPTLQLLEDRGWVSAETVEGKKVYAITDAGRTALAEHEQRGGEFRGPRFRGGRGRGPFGWEMSPDLASLGRESMQVAHMMRRAVMASGGDPERLARLRAIVERAHDELNEFVGQAGAGGRPGAGGEPGPQGGPVEHL